MIDDVKVILAEYRLALKIYNSEREKMKKLKSVGLFLVIIIFGILFVPKFSIELLITNNR